MPSKIEEYALLSDCRSAALVDCQGSVDWLCLPRYDSDAVFAALLGTHENGFWKISPAAPYRAVRRSYRGNTLVVDTELTCDAGTIVITDFMPIREDGPGLVRIVTGKEGTVRVRSEVAFRFNYGKTVPWVRKHNDGIKAIAGPDCLTLATHAPLHGERLRTVSDFVIRKGEKVPFCLLWSRSYAQRLKSCEAEHALAEVERSWRSWADRCSVEGHYREPILRSLLTLKALTYHPTGGIVAAATTSLPEALGGVRNWDYRFCWLRDSTFTLYALMSAGFDGEARAWRDWLLRAAAGAPDQLQILYGIAGERRLNELELDWLSGYDKSRPVRIGNLASEQLQLDVYGELADALYLARTSGLDQTMDSWNLERALLKHLETMWEHPDHGIWEVRGEPRHFVHSKVMCWVAFDRGVKSIERWGLQGPLDRWRAIRARIHQEVCDRGYDEKVGTFVQHYGSREPDASLLLLPIVGFLPPDDRRIVHTVDTIQKRLMADGFVRRYIPDPDVDGLPHGEGTFLACSFWLVDALVLLGRHREAVELFERLLGMTNDVGLLAEQYDPATRRMLGNFPQALSHVALVNSALNVSRIEGPARHRHRH
jgi:GH15 family glucan-1,4-alpha-glucosidase